MSNNRQIDVTTKKNVKNAMKELKNNRVSTFLLCISQLLYNKGRARDSWGRPLGLLIIRANMAVTICEIPGRTPLWADGTKERTVNYSILVSCSLSLSDHTLK